MEKACHTEPGKTRIARSVQQIPSLIEQNYHYRRDMYALRASRLGLMVNILDVNAQPNAANRAPILLPRVSSRATAPFVIRPTPTTSLVTQHRTHLTLFLISFRGKR